MKRAAAVMVLLVSSVAAAQNVRLEIGVNGFYPAGEWTNCRVSGLDNVPDGTLVTIRVSDMFERRLRIERGAAQGLILIPDDAPSIELDVAGIGRVRVPREDLRRLHGVKDRLPVLFVGDNATEASADLRRVIDRDLETVPVSVDEFLLLRPEEHGWLRAVAVGTVPADCMRRDVALHVADWTSSAILARREFREFFAPAFFAWAPDNVAYLIHNASLVEFAPLPRGSVRGELYEIFGAPSWTDTSRGTVALSVGAVLLVAALYAIRPARFVASLAVAGAFVAAVLLIGFIVCRWGVQPPPVEVVSLLEGDPPRGWQTDVYSRFSLTRGMAPREWPVDSMTPVASYRGQWLKRPVVVDETGRLLRSTEAPLREVALRVRLRPMDMPVESEYWVTGENVYVAEFNEGDVPLRFYSTTDGLFRRQLHPNRRVDELRRAFLRYWMKTRPRSDVDYRLGWTPAVTDGPVLSAGTLVVRELNMVVY